MIINTCTTSKSFSDDYWIKIFQLIHEDLNLDILPPKDPENFENWKIQSPDILLRYWKYLWKYKGNIGEEYLNPSNIKIRGLQKIWEYTQVIACISYILHDKLNDKKILSLGAGFEGSLFVFDKLGADVYASDIYDSPYFWNPSLVKYIEKNPQGFCHYKNFKTNVKYLNINLKSKKDLSKLGLFDIIYSISSLEHLYTSYHKKKKLFLEIADHIKINGIFCFTTEFVIKYDKIRNYTQILYEFIDRIKGKFSTKSNIKTKKKNDLPHKRFSFSDRGVKIYKSNPLQQILRYFKKNKHIFQYHRRYDFFTLEELQLIINSLKKKKLYLLEEVDWNSCFEHPIKTPKFKNHYHSHISLTFRKK